MPSARVTSKGQITIPVDIRRALALEPGTRVDFVPTDSGTYEIRRETRSMRDLQGYIEAPPRPVSISDMDDAIAAAATDSG